MIFSLIVLIFTAWIIFGGGAEKLENSFFGYLGFGGEAQYAMLIKMAAGIGGVYIIVSYF